jgi:hypothetical protein
VEDKQPAAVVSGLDARVYQSAETLFKNTLEVTTPAVMISRKMADSRIRVFLFTPTVALNTWSFIRSLSERSTSLQQVHHGV